MGTYHVLYSSSLGFDFVQTRSGAFGKLWNASKLSRIEYDRLVPSPYFIYLLFKDDERLGRNDIIVRIAVYAGKDDKK